MADDAFVIGRFQPLHKGHEDLLDYTIDEYDTVTVVMTEGTDVPSDRNPLNMDERDALLEELYEGVTEVSIEHLYGVDEALQDGIEPVTETLASQYDDPTDAVCVTGNPETIEVLEETYTIEEPPDNDYREKPFRGGYVREMAATDQEWRPFVSDPVEDLLDKYDFEDRITDLWEE